MAEKQESEKQSSPAPIKPTADNSSEACRRSKTVGEEALLKISKEIAVKFIEVGRVSPANFHHTFLEIHQTIRQAADEDR